MGEKLGVDGIGGGVVKGVSLSRIILPTEVAVSSP